MATRGYVWCLYFNDDGRSWSMRVDADFAADPARGWTPTTDPTVPPLPRGWEPRFVWGSDDTGAWRSTRVGTTDCDLWTGVATAFNIHGTDLAEHTVTRRGRKEENTFKRPH